MFADAKICLLFLRGRKTGQCKIKSGKIKGAKISWKDDKGGDGIFSSFLSKHWVSLPAPKPRD